MRRLALKLSIVIFSISLLILLILINTIEPNLSKINQLKSYEIFKKIKITAYVTKINNYNDFTIIKVKDKTGSINIFTDIQNLNISKNQNLMITGKITEYKEDIQITAEIIKVLY
ncbi:hypothetical protein GOV12_06710 [Candidatus Pacearchaeota archaeon]|nr:hypothetical protein [Candidatus Pacearchaeota archaeon]